MAIESAYGQARWVEAAILAILSTVDVADEEPGTRKLLADIKHEITDARLDVRDYEFADTRFEQQSGAGEARKRLVALRERIADPNLHGIFGAVDVAQLSAKIDTLIGALE